MTKARKYTVDKNLSAHYHVVNKCVQSVFLMGDDLERQISYGHRREWFHERLVFLANVFTLEIGGFAIMSNHYHLLLKTRPDKTESLKDADVAKRWFLLFPPKVKKSITSRADQILAHEIDLLNNPKKLVIYRERLGSLSWFMKSMNEHIARKGNEESGCKGRFWQGRFYSKLLTSAEAVLPCQTYIDLNPIRAGIATTPENSTYTSAHDRIHANQNQTKLRDTQKFLSENQGSELSPYQKEMVNTMKETIARSKCLAPFYQGEKHEKPFFKITEKEYLDLLDWSGRMIKQNKKGKIPLHLKPIFDRLEIDRHQWLESIKNYNKWFYRIVGKMTNAWEMLKHTATQWFKGTKINQKLFGT